MPPEASPFRPDFLLLGAAKSGTTSLAYYLGQHPDVCFSEPKEPVFFEAEFEQGLEFYRQKYFGHRQRETCAGEGRVFHLYLPFVADRVRDVAPEARLVALLRDPVDRAYSHWWHRFSRGIEPLPFAEAIERNLADTGGEARFEGEEGAKRWREGLVGLSVTTSFRLYLELGRYAEQLDQWLDRFDASQLEVCLYEDLSRDPARVTRGLWRFLGVDPDAPLVDPEAQNVRQQVVRTPRVARLVRSLEGSGVGPLFPAAARARLRGLIPERAARRPVLDSGLRSELTGWYRDHNERLEERLGRDLGLEAGGVSRLARMAGGPLLLAAALLPAFLLGEALVRWRLPAPTRYQVYTPGTDVALEPVSELMPGVEGPTRFLVNSDGMRADEPPEGEAYRILAVGGSTTQCLYLDQDEAWPARLEVLLGEQTGARVWVGNVGKAGRYSSDHVLQVRHLLPQNPDLDVLVMLLGANDAYRRLGRDDYRPRDPFDPADRAYLLPRAFEIHPREVALWPPARTALWGLVQVTRERLRTRANWRNREDLAGRSYAVWREQRARAARLREVPPDLEAALEEYVGNLHHLVGIARRQGVRPVFLTQPTIYRADLPEAERALLWMGRVGPPGELGENEYYSVAALERAFASYNAALLGFCAEAAAECLDLAALMPRDTRSFYDDVHFNEPGAERVAQAVTRYLAKPGAIPQVRP